MRPDLDSQVMVGLDLHQLNRPHQQCMATEFRKNGGLQATIFFDGTDAGAQPGIKAMAAAAATCSIDPNLLAN